MLTMVGGCYASIATGTVLGQSQWKFHLHLMSCHISAFDDVARFLIRERRSEFHGDETLLARIPTLYES